MESENRLPDFQIRELKITTLDLPHKSDTKKADKDLYKWN